MNKRYACFFLSSFLLYGRLSFKDVNYFIKEGYISRNEYHHHDDREFTDGSQDEIYMSAYQLTRTQNLKTIADIGCGSGYKLIKYFKDYDTVGYEIEPTLSFLKDKYPDKVWEQSAFNSDPYRKDVDLIICADVIEHLVDPDELLNYIDKFNFKYLVISTPDRNKLPQVQHTTQSQTGPPVNTAHVREWSFEELEKYLSQYFTIIQHSNSPEEFWCQMIIATKKT